MEQKPGAKTDQRSRYFLPGIDAAHLTALVESSYEPIAAINLSGILTAWNQGAEDLLGYTAEEVLGKHAAFFAPLERKDDVDRMLSDLVKGSDPNHRYETVRIHKNGKYIEVAITVSPIYDDGGALIGGAAMFLDLTSIRKIEHALKETERRKDIFINTVSQELKTPLSTAQALAYLLTRQLEFVNNERACQFLERIEVQLEKLNQLIAVLMDISKAQMKKIVLVPHLFALDELLVETVRDVQAQNHRHRIELTEWTHAMVRADRERIRQVLNSLMANAIKFSPVADHIEVGIKSEEQHTTIFVRDYGIGIPARAQQHIFKRFYRVGGEEDQKFPGLGTGLYLAAEIIKCHGGQIWFESREHEGSTFYVALPLAVDLASSGESTSVAAQ